ncbi:N-acetylneuraminate synthase family protein [Lederbergia graminis]|uniref:N-acetylneuraminate synthase family protein n=1 Tax=Lederbergia graminis TaxID=735518 RepID=A0ABW0LN08_9BACI
MIDNSILKDLIIFEMANSHQGSLEHGINIIKKMGKITRKYNIKSAVKLQYRNLDNFIHPSFLNRDDVKHVPRFMSTRLSREEFNTLVQVIRDEGMIAISTPFDEDSVELCLDQGLDIIKVASCSAMDWPLLEVIAKTKKPIIISTGGLSLSDIDKVYNFFTHRECNFAIMHCVASYPAPAEQLQLDFIDKLKKRYRDIPIGYSGHEDPTDTMVPTVSVAKGVEIFERHVGLPTENISLNAYSMNPEQTDKWVETIQLARKMCKVPNDIKYISQDEVDSLNSLKRGVYVKRVINKGEVLNREDVFFAMPCADGQMTSGEFTDGTIATRDYKELDAVYEIKKISDVSIVRSVIHDAKGMLYEAGITLGPDFEVELSHHYGMKHFRKIGAIIVTVVNREYCKKLIIVLPGQKNPIHFHKEKEETFQLLYGDLDITINGEQRSLNPGDLQTIIRGQKHSFSSIGGAIFEEISTTHVRNDSYYEDEMINKLDPMERKTILSDW